MSCKLGASKKSSQMFFIFGKNCYFCSLFLKILHSLKRTNPTTTAAYHCVILVSIILIYFIRYRSGRRSSAGSTSRTRTSCSATSPRESARRRSSDKSRPYSNTSRYSRNLILWLPRDSTKIVRVSGFCH